MKRKWKYDNQLAISNWYLAKGKWQYAICLLLIAVCVFTIPSCNNSADHNHIVVGKSINLNALTQPSNETVFSDISAISPIRKSITPILSATGVISYDPLLLNNISARFGGRIEKLYVHFNFENVHKGQRIMDIYSPEILSEQKNLIFLLNNSADNVSLINSSKQKLQLLGLTDEQLKQIETTKRAIDPLPIFSPYTGHIHDMGSANASTTKSSMNEGMNSGMNNTITSSSQVQIENLPSSQTAALTLKEGMYIQSGQSIFSVYNTDQLWAVLNIFPADASLVKVGDKVSITAETSPENVISSTIKYMEPVTGQNASAIKARVYLQNAENLHLKIGTLLSAKITPAAIHGLWLPRKAVVNLGQRQIVFLKSENHFTSKIIQTGVVTDSLIQITCGLTDKEQVAANAQYMVDSESFIQTNDNEEK